MSEVIQWRRREATKRLKHLLKLDPDNERALFNLGMLAMDNGDMNAAEHHFKVCSSNCESYIHMNLLMPINFFFKSTGFSALEIQLSICTFQFGFTAK